MNNIINNFKNVVTNTEPIATKDINFLKQQAKQLFGQIMGEVGELTKFVNYDSGLSYTNKDYASYKDRCKACNDFETGILTQGMFQTSQLDEQRYKEVQEFLDKHKNNIAKINFFQLSESLIDAVNPILDAIPAVNIYHTAIGITFVDKNNKIIRSAILQLNFGAYGDASNLFDRFLAPHFCMNAIIDPQTGVAKDPSTFTDAEFTENLFIDYSKTISSLMFSFNEDQDYVTEKLIETMSCVDVANLASAAPVPYGKFINQNITCKTLYDSYHKQKTGLFKKHQGDADGTIFCLNSFGPSVLTSQTGVILHFASLTNVEKMKSFIDWCFVNYGSCSATLENNDLQHYCLVGVDKMYPINQYSNTDISNIVKKENIISTDNGFIREMKGRTTHCNTVCAVCITLIDQLAKNDSDWTIYTNWQSEELQEINNYMINPCIANIPVISFAKGWENGCTVEKLNMDPSLSKDKARFYKLWFFARMLVKGLKNIAANTALSSTSGDMATDSASGLTKLVFDQLVNYMGSSVLQSIIGVAAGPETAHRLKQGNAILMVLLLLYIIIEFDLFDTFYWATGQSTTTENGEVDFLVTDPYPTIWKIELNKENKNILLAYIESVFIKNTPNKSLRNAGEIYSDLESKKQDSYTNIDFINRITHTFANNKFFLWFPGVKNNNTCANGYLQNRPAITYLPLIKHNFVDNPKLSDSLNMGNTTNSNKTNNTNKYLILFMVVIILLLITFAIYYLTQKRNN
jgi:hypothetical protein